MRAEAKVNSKVEKRHAETANKKKFKTLVF